MPEQSPRTPIIVAKVGRKFGVRGCFNLQSHTSPPENITQFSELLIDENGTWRTYEVEYIKPKNKNVFICKLKGIDTPEQASMLTHAQIAVRYADLPPTDNDEFYWVDLIGLKVQTPTGEELGVVSEILETGANDVLCIKPSNGPTVCIPFLSKYITDIDTESQVITTNWSTDYLSD